jgi:tetratricopeptide (TPR) repeat protein
MTNLASARREEAAGRPAQAIGAYEKALAEEAVDLDAYLDLAVLYLNCCDFGFAAHHKLPPDLEAGAYEKALEVLRKAEAAFGNHSEIEFWRRYLRFAVLGEDLTIDDVLRLINKDESLVPYLFVAGAAGHSYAGELQQLRKEVAPGRTTRQRYVRGFLDRDAKLSGRISEWGCGGGRRS